MVSGFSGPYLSLMGCQGSSPSLPMPRSGHTATMAFRMRDMLAEFPASLAHVTRTPVFKLGARGDSATLWRREETRRVRVCVGRTPAASSMEN